MQVLIYAGQHELKNGDADCHYAKLEWHSCVIFRVAPKIKKS